jgi:hypothetical protein
MTSEVKGTKGLFSETYLGHFQESNKMATMIVTYLRLFCKHPTLTISGIITNCIHARLVSDILFDSRLPGRNP